MNVLTGNISSIQSHEELSLVKVQCNALTFASIVLDTPETVNYLRVEHAVKVIFKETEVIISKNLELAISIQNQFLCTIQSIKKE